MTHSFPTRRSSDRIVGILATLEVFILAARGKAVEARDARLQSVGIDAELRGECLQRRRCRQQLTTNLPRRSEEHTSELQSLMRTSYAVFCLKKKKNKNKQISTIRHSIH